MEGGQRQASATVSRQQAGGSSLGASKRAHSPQQVNSRSGWAVEPPRSRVEKRSAVDRVLGLSSHARTWLGPEMVRKGRKRAVPMPLVYHEVCAHRSLVSRALADWSDMCTMSGCECWDDLFAKYGVVGSQQ